MKTYKCMMCNSIYYTKLFNKNKYKVIRCNNCGFIYIYPIPNKQQLDNYYNKFEYKTGLLNEISIRKDSIRTLNNLNRLVNKIDLLLDVGCGAGFFMDEARKYNWVTQGVETSKKASNYAKNNLNLKVSNADFLDYQIPNNRFTVITLIQVIEHLVDPKPVLRKIYKLLNSNGILCISTPNTESYLTKVMKDDCNYIIPPEHVAYYSVRTLKRLLDEENFKIIKTFTWGYPSDLAAIIKRLIFGTPSSACKKNNNLYFKNDISIQKKIKSFIFDNVFCKILYPVLNYNNGGSILEIYATKK